MEKYIKEIGRNYEMLVFLDWNLRKWIWLKGVKGFIEYYFGYFVSRNFVCVNDIIMRKRYVMK